MGNSEFTLVDIAIAVDEARSGIVGSEVRANFPITYVAQSVGE